MVHSSLRTEWSCDLSVSMAFYVIAYMWKISFTNMGESSVIIIIVFELVQSISQDLVLLATPLPLRTGKGFFFQA